MPRHHRLEDVSCAICMDTLFCQRDDLDEAVPIATPDCGHVFHEKCLLEWFRTQSAQYLAAAREQGIRFRGDSPTLSDAPCECPTCRTECFADPETGEPIIHRLFINFEGGDGGGSGPGSGAGSSSQAGPGSSPPRRAWGGKGKEKEVLGLARRARNLGEEVKGLKAESAEEDVEGMLRRAEGLRDDAVSSKALDGFKKYLGGLTSAINTLRASLETHPLVPTLHHRLAEAQRENTRLQHQAHTFATTILRQEVDKAVSDERAKSERRVRKVQDDCELIKRELEREQVARKSARKAMEERMSEAEKKMTEMTKTLEAERADREAARMTLHERNKLLKLYQAKAESRKTLKSQLDDLKAENGKLKSMIERQSIPPPAGRLSVSEGQRSEAREDSYPMLDVTLDQDDEEEDEEPSGDISIQEISAAAFSVSQQARSHHNPPRTTPDDSLEVDMPSFADKSFRRNRDDLPGPSRRNPTARTFSSDQFATTLGSPSPIRKRPKTSKYFIDENDDSSDSILVPPSSTTKEREWGTERERKEEKGRDSLSLSPVKRSRTNPFSSTREDTERRKRIEMGSHHVIDLSTPSPRVKGPLASSERGNEVSGVVTSVGVGRDAGERQSMVDWLGMRDAAGRPKKGLATGVKVKRRA